MKKILFFLSLTLIQSAQAQLAKGCFFKTPQGKTIGLGFNSSQRVLNFLSVIGKPQVEGLGPLYEPQKLVAISLELMTPFYQKFLAVNNVEEFMQQEAYDHMVSMLNDARTAQINLYIHSAYRSYATQCSVFSRALKKEIVEHNTSIENSIKAVNTRSALPGQSEHQLGTVADLVTYLPQFQNENDGYALKFELQETPAFIWLTQNAANYGFALSYPRDTKLGIFEENTRTGYKYEPWHWRYIGVEKAKNFKLCRDMVLKEYLKNLSTNPNYKCP